MVFNLAHGPSSLPRPRLLLPEEIADASVPRSWPVLPLYWLCGDPSFMRRTFADGSRSSRAHGHYQQIVQPLKEGGFSDPRRCLQGGRMSLSYHRSQSARRGT